MSLFFLFADNEDVLCSEDIEWCKLNLPDALETPTDDVEEELPRKKLKSSQPQVSHDYLNCIYELVSK